MKYLKHCAKSLTEPTLLNKKAPHSFIVDCLNGIVFDHRAKFVQHTIQTLTEQGYDLDSDFLEKGEVVFQKKKEMVILVDAEKQWVEGVAYKFRKAKFQDMRIVTFGESINEFDFTHEIVNAIAEKIEKRKDVFTVGSHCSECPYELECPAIEVQSRLAISKLSERTTTIDSYDDYLLAKKAVEDFKKSLDLDLEKHGIISNSKYSIQKVRAEKLVIPATKAVNFLKSLHDDAEELLDDVKLSKESLSSFIRSKAERGNKEAYMNQILEEMKVNDIVKVEDSFRIKVEER